MYINPLTQKPFTDSDLSEAVNNCRHGAYEYGALTEDDGEPLSGGRLGLHSAEVTCEIIKEAGALACVWTGDDEELTDHDQDILNEYDGLVYQVHSGDEHLIIVTDDLDALTAKLLDTFAARVAVMSDNEIKVLEVHRS
jgi:hypothetical protein